MVKNDALMPMGNTDENLYNETQPLLIKKWISLAVASALTVITAFVLFPLLDKTSVTNAYLGYVTSLEYTFFLIAPAYLLGYGLKKLKYGLDNKALFICIVSALGFALVYTALINYRYTYRYEMIDTQEVSLEDDDDFYEEPTMSEEQLQLKYAPEAQAYFLLLSIEPLLSSIITGIMSYWSEDEMLKRILVTKKHINKFDNKMTQLDLVVEEHSRNRMEELSENLKQAHEQKVKEYKERQNYYIQRAEEIWAKENGPSGHTKIDHQKKRYLDA